MSLIMTSYLATIETFRQRSWPNCVKEMKKKNSTEEDRLWLKGVLEKSTKIVVSWRLARTTLVSLYSCNQAKLSI